MDGILLIDKPEGWSSFDVIRKLRSQLAVAESLSPDSAKPLERKSKSRLRSPKMGHAGTLDPLATGLLVVLVGQATKQQDRFMKLDKVYEAEITLGATSTTEDREGTITVSDNGKVEPPSKQEVEAALESFTGTIEQVPPQFSAIKVDGRRAYKTARAGGTLELKSRAVTVYELKNKGYDYPILRMEARVSSGTYIRSLARDIGVTLKTGAYLSALRRTSIGDFQVEDALSPMAEAKELSSRLLSFDK